MFNNKNERQKYFNQIRGVVSEINISDEFCSITLTCGHENPRQVNLAGKKEFFIEHVVDKIKLEQKVTARFFLVSVNKNGRWLTTAKILEISKGDFKPQ